MNKKLFIILRYLIIISIIFSLSINQDNISIISIILTLLFVINGQIRYFILFNNTKGIFVSLTLEYLLGYFCIKYSGVNILQFFIIGIIDSFLMLNGWYSLLSIILGFLTLINISIHREIKEIMSNILIFLSISVISYNIYLENYKKTRAEDLYYKLKKSEDELIKANNELEIYASSIKELSILKERNRISREIHDSVGHSLSTIIIQLGAIEKISESTATANMAANLREFAKNSLDEIRKALRELKPGQIKEYETIIAVEELIRDFSKLTGIEVKLGFSKQKWQIHEEMSLTIYRIVQEFLSNSARHGKATKVNIFMHFNEDDLIITLKDNGIGTDYIKPGMGLTNLSERVNELGGKVNYESQEDMGFLMRAVLPVNK